MASTSAPGSRVGTCPGRGCGCACGRPAGWGVRGRTLELDTAAGPDDDGVLVILGRRDLGTDPEDVARALRDLDPTR